MLIMKNLLTFNLINAQRVVTRWINQRIKEAGFDISITQFYCLWASKEYFPSNITVLSKHLCMDRTTLFRALEHIKELVELTNQGNDFRSRIPVVTKKGQLLLDKLAPIILETDEYLERELKEYEGATELFYQLMILSKMKMLQPGKSSKHKKPSGADNGK